MAFDVRYSRSERLFHRVAFAGPAVQITAADIEDKTFARGLAGANDRDPVLVTSLARAGTTLALEILSRLPALAAHSYRDMPFVLAPVLWERLSRGFRKSGETRERAHGDGVEIGFDSPESFEEVFWKAHWPGKYRDPAGIALWRAADADAEATAFFRRHMAKIVGLRRPEAMDRVRYVSKNNANVARLELLETMLPDARVVLVLRDPLEHAYSLWRQHRNFMALQADDPFVARYMADIGHYEFGAMHRPLMFDGMAEALAGHDPATPDYWLAYWLCAFAHLRRQADRVTILPYEPLCAAPMDQLGRLCARLDVPADGLDAAGAHVRPAVPRADASVFDAALSRRAAALFADLAALA